MMVSIFSFISDKYVGWSRDGRQILFLMQHTYSCIHPLPDRIRLLSSMHAQGELDNSNFSKGIILVLPCRCEFDDDIIS